MSDGRLGDSELALDAPNVSLRSLERYRRARDQHRGALASSGIAAVARGTIGLLEMTTELLDRLVKPFGEQTQLREHAIEVADVLPARHTCGRRSEREVVHRAQRFGCQRRCRTRVTDSMQRFEWL